MSAFKVSDRHIHVIAAAACSLRYFSYVWRGKVRTLDMSHADRVCAMLATENDRSLAACYPRDFTALGASKRKSTLRFCDRSVEVHSTQSGDFNGLSFMDAVGTVTRYSAAQIYKLVRCYEYQACEHDGWMKSEAHALQLALQAQIGNVLIHAAKLTESAEWSI